jgi:hypothetical protein
VGGTKALLVRVFIKQIPPIEMAQLTMTTPQDNRRGVLPNSLLVKNETMTNVKSMQM